MLDINNAQDQLTDLVTELEGAISTLVLASNIPLIGDHVTTATVAILAGLQEAKTKIEQVFDTIPNDADVIDALAAAINDIEILGQQDLIVATVNAAGDLDVRLAYEDDVDVSSGDLSFGASTGLLGSFDATGSVALEAEAAFDINFTIDKDDGSIALDRDATDEEFTLGLKGEVDYDTTAKLGFLTVNIADNDATPDGTLDDIELDIALDLRSGAGNDPTVKVSGHATIDADVTVEDTLLSILPGVEGALLVDLSYTDADLTGDAPAAFGLDIQLKDVKLKIDGLVDLYNSIFGELDDIFDSFPIGQIVDILTAKLPVISDIAPSSLDIYPGDGDGKISLADVVVFLAQIKNDSSPALDFILAVIKVADAIKALEALGDALGDGEFSVGDINLAGSALDSIADGMGVADGQNLVESGGSDLTALVDFINAVKGIASDGDSSAAADSGPAPAAFAVPATASATDVEPDDSIVKFPWLSSTDALLESLASLMLNGFGAQPVTLVEFDIPELAFGVQQRLPITFGVFYGFVEGSLDAKIDINAGYDTAGFTNDGFAFADGFYVSPDLNPINTGEVDDMGMAIMKQPFGNMALGLRAGGGVDVVLARVEIAGGLLGEINVFLGGTDENDNKAYLSELAGCLINDISGRIAVGLDLTISIGFGIFSISKTIGLAEVTLAQFNIDPCANHGGAAIPEVDESGLAFALDSGVLILNVGSRAGLRTIEDAVDQNYDGDGQATGGPSINEVFSVTRVPPQEVDEGEPAPDPIDPFDQLAVQAFGVFERYDVDANFNLIQANGGSGDDRLSVEAGIDIDAEFFGGDGKDILKGSDGDDLLDGGDEKDQLFGGAGDDTLLGGDGNDVLSGGAGADFIDGQVGGADQIDYSGSSQGVSLIASPIDASTSLGSGGDAEGDVVRNVEYFIGSRFDDTFYGNLSESNVFDAGRGNDVLVGGDEGDLFIGGRGADAMYGNQNGRANTANDAASYVFSEGAVNINIATNVALGGEAQGDTFFGIEDFQLTRFSDRIVGDDKANLIDAYDGDDFVDGGGGADTVLAGLGDDIVRGGLDGDVLNGGGFVNRLRDKDLLSYETSAIAVNASLFAGVAFGIGGGGTDTIERAQFLFTDEDGKPVFQDIADDYGYRASTFENLRGSSQNDILTGDDQYNRIEGGGGADQIFGGGGFDTIVGGTGADALDGGAGVDTAEYKTSLLGVRADLLLGGTTGDAAGDSYTDVENLIGSRQTDILIGDNEDNELDPYLNLGGGTEQLIGRGGKDTAILNFANGFDDVGKFISLAATGAGAVTETGNVTRVTMSGIEQMKAYTGEGNDIVLSAAIGDDVVNTHGGRDLISVGAGFDIVYAGADDDFVLRGDFNTNQSTSVGGFDTIAQSFFLDGGTGRDGLAIDLSFATQNLTLFSDGVGGITGGEELAQLGGSFINFEALIGAFGGSGNDVLGQLGEVNSFFAGNAGEDTITTGFGFDTADGGESSRFEFGFETFEFFEDVDTLIVDYSSAEAGIMVSSYEPTNIDAADVGRVALIDGSDDVAPELAATDFRNFERLFLTGTDRNDVLIGMDQADDLVNGDVLIGGEGNDSILGGAGNDILIGASRGGTEEELDLLTGGDGSDRFVLADKLGLIGDNVEDGVGITDFSREQDDVIVLAGEAGAYEIETQEFNLSDRPIFVSVISVIGVGLSPARPIAYVTSDHAPDLSSEQFEYVGPSPVLVPSFVVPSPVTFDAPSAFSATSFGGFQTLLESSVTDQAGLSLGLFSAGVLSDELAIEAVSAATQLASTTAIPMIDLDLNNLTQLPETVALALTAEGASTITTADVTFDAQTMIDNVIAGFAEEAFEISDTAFFSTTTYEGNGAAAGTFENMFGLDDGFVLSTGRVDEIIGENTEDGQFNLAPESTIELPLVFEDLGQIGGSRNLYRALLPSVPGGIASLTLTDDADYTGGAPGRFSAFDLDVLKLSTSLVDITNVAEFEALESLDVFDFSPTGTVFTPGAQREGLHQSPDLFGSINGFLNQGEARLDLGGGSTGTQDSASGGISLGEGGSLGFNLTSNVSSTEDGPVYLYLVENGAKEDLNGVVQVSSQPIDTLGDLSTDLGAPGLEGDTTKITSTFTVDFAGGKPDFAENTMVDFFDIVMVTEELPERGGIMNPDHFRVLINGFDAIGDGEGGTITMNSLAPTPFGDYAEGLTLNLVGDGPMVDEIRADAYTVVYRVSGPIIDGLNTIEIEVSDQKDAFLDTALFIAAAGAPDLSNQAPIARNDLLDVVEGDGGSVDLIAGIGFDSDADGDALSVESIGLLNADGTVRQTIDAGLAGFTQLDGGNGSVRVSASGVLEFETGSDFDALNTGDLQSVRFDYTLSDGTDVDTGQVTVRVIGEDEVVLNTAPQITSGTAFSVAENTTGPIALSAVDPESDPLTWAITGGDDAALFAIDATTGAVSFVAAPDFEAPSDAGGDNVYDVTVNVSDASLSDSAAIAISVTDVDESTPLNTIIGTDGRDSLIGTNADDIIWSKAGSYDRITGGDGADVFVFGPELSNGAKERDRITDFEAGVDSIGLTTEDYTVRFSNNYALISAGEDQDRIYVYGNSLDLDDLGLTLIETDNSIFS